MNFVAGNYLGDGILDFDLLLVFWLIEAVHYSSNCYLRQVPLFLENLEGNASLELLLEVPEALIQ